MPRKYELKVIEDDEQTHMIESASGFSELEIIGLLSIRIAEIQNDLIKTREDDDNTNKP